MPEVSHPRIGFVVGIATTIRQNVIVPNPVRVMTCILRPAACLTSADAGGKASDTRN